MHPTRSLRDLEQSLWLGDIALDLLPKGTLERYIEELSVTGLTSNPAIFDHAVTHSSPYDREIRTLAASRLPIEVIFFELALQDLTRAADLFSPIHRRTAGADGFIPLEVSPLLAHDTARTVELYRKAARQNLLTKIPGTNEGLPAIEEAIFSGIPVDVTLLSREHYVVAETTRLRDADRCQYDFGLADIAELWRRGSAISSWLLDVTASAMLHDPKLERVSSRGETDFADEVLSAMRHAFGVHEEKKS